MAQLKKKEKEAWNVPLKKFRELTPGVLLEMYEFSFEKLSSDRLEIRKEKIKRNS